MAECESECVTERRTKRGAKCRSVSDVNSVALKLTIVGLEPT